MVRKSTQIETSTVSIPRAMAEDIDALIERLGYWPSRSAFARDAILKEIRRLQDEHAEEK